MMTLYAMNHNKLMHYLLPNVFAGKKVKPFKDFTHPPCRFVALTTHTLTLANSKFFFFFANLTTGANKVAFNDQATNELTVAVFLTLGTSA